MTLAFDFYLDPTTGDLDVRNGDLILKADIRQAINIKLRWIRGEWFRNTLLGIPSLTNDGTQDKNPNLNHLAAFVRTAILSIEGVKNITSFDMSMESVTRQLTIEWAADTDDGALDGAEVF